MASVAGTPPLSAYEFDPDENALSWTNISSVPNSAGPGSSVSGDFFSSPSAGSLTGSWQMVGPSPPAVSPLNPHLELDHSSAFPAMRGGYEQSFNNANVTSVPSTANVPFFPASAMGIGQGSQNYAATPAGLMLFNDQQLNEMLSSLEPLMPGEQSFQLSGFDLPQGLQPGVDLSPSWEMPPSSNPTSSSKAGDSPIFVMEDPSFVSPSPPLQPMMGHYSPSVSPPASSCAGASPRSSIHQRSPVSAHVKRETSDDRKTTTNNPMPIRKVGANSRVQKKKAPSSESSSSSSLSSSRASSAGSSSSSSKFHIVTPESVNAHAGKPNPFECFEAMRPSQRGRKGPLANDTKENALQVRRLGACFCCHARKVKCDKERPCRNCTKLCLQVPQVICWQFQDFLPVLFPEFIRGHFKKDEMARFISDNIEAFTVGGVEKPCTVELFSGSRFRAKLSLRARFFTAKTADVLQHWHMQTTTVSVDGKNLRRLEAVGAAPIGLPETGHGQKDDLRKKVREYIQNIVEEHEVYAEQVTETLRHTELPRKILRIVQKYSRGTDSPIVRRALNIYAMHYVLTRHLCLTQHTIMNLGPTRLIPQNNSGWVTPRVLNRQVKAVVDDMLMREMQLLFENFSKSLKPKSRKEWAPCLAAFLVLCLFMESVETAADAFVVSENEVSFRNRDQRGVGTGAGAGAGTGTKRYKRSFARGITREVENLPFKQFAYQFHQIYQTHSRDAAARSFNPLMDDACFAEQGELDSCAAEMVWQLRRFIQEPNYWSELDYLTFDPIMPNQVEDEYPRSMAHDYTGRLVSKFLLSFTDERYIFGL
ncbi:hypothetical protein QBC46DRAFT_156468 [Diplogelasinospora grovesii]|uniref:Zn(2)-C6 fungal-type domain-containing protein n=1 Tax=Diplogelasinospora grovesii TaxID=303347 RepID=A0AAN6S9B1_9PEZI|nr:hypothetical protein QBC46DRAFT_156468 [Diplogelasinospora grovesii]